MKTFTKCRNCFKESPVQFCTNTCEAEFNKKYFGETDSLTASGDGYPTEDELLHQNPTLDEVKLGHGLPKYSDWKNSYPTEAELINALPTSEEISAGRLLDR